MKATVPFKTRFQLLSRYPFEPGEMLPMKKFQEFGQVLALIWRTLFRMAYQESGLKGGPIMERANVCKTTGTDLFLDFTAKGFDFRLKGINVLKNNHRKFKTEPPKLHQKPVNPGLRMRHTYLYF